MGKRKFVHKKKGQKSENGDTWGTRNKRGPGYDEIIKENASFEGYYKAQKIVPEAEWDSFLSHLKDALPVSFRISGHRTQAKEVLKIIQGKYFHELVGGEAQPQCLPWYPDNLGWQLNLSKKDVRKNEAYSRLHNFLVSETETGSISRQEAVSMIPPLVLDVQPHHKVLDMCAAPGSKTTQLIEALHSEEGKIPGGFVVANDSNNKRCYMLVHQLKRLMSPTTIITNHDATIMPNFRMTSADGEKFVKFDRILCDVPCTGDGTMRKNIDVWMKWNTANACNLHGIQYRVARRGVEMLTIDGKMVYSTCSLNPIEDEAVLHRLLVEAKGSLELVDVAHKLPGLKYVKGLSHWVVMNRDLTVYEKPEDVPDAIKNLIRPNIFPPTAEDAKQFHFDRCIRVLPHQQNTGGFFVAVLKKVAPLPWESAPKPVEAKSEDTKTNETKTVGESGPRSPSRKKARTFGYKEDPYIFFEKDEELWPSIKEFYGISDTLDSSLLFVRCKEGNKRNIYFTNAAVMDVTKKNEDRIKIINTGVKMFIRSDNKGADCVFRIAQEGAPILMEHMTKRCVKLTRGDMTLLLLKDDLEAPLDTSKLSDAAQAQLTELSTGCVVLENNDETLKIVLVGWKGKSSLRAYIPKSERVHYLRLCGADVSKFEVNKFEKERLAAANSDAKDDKDDDQKLSSEDEDGE